MERQKQDKGYLLYRVKGKEIRSFYHHEFGSGVFIVFQNGVIKASFTEYKCAYKYVHEIWKQ